MFQVHDAHVGKLVNGARQKNMQNTCHMSEGVRLSKPNFFLAVFIDFTTV